MRHDPDALMLFAAGKGTRMGTLTADRPKPLIEVAGRALIDHAIDLTEGVPLSRVVVNLHYLPGQLRAHPFARNDILFSDEPELLETGGGLRAALPLLGLAPVYTLNSDAIWTGGNPLARLRAAWDPARMDALVMLIPKEQARSHKGRGDFVMDAEGRLSRGPGPIYSGAQILKTELLTAIPEPAFSPHLVWDLMIARRRLFGLLHDGEWCDVGHPEGITLAEQMLRESGDV
ncbi:nucleotidyltransferase family protein [Thioclava sp. BHET1]|nr:nucleotidyltransferase family protein [Thioclava sp. BHET1]